MSLKRNLRIFTRKNQIIRPPTYRDHAATDIIWVHYITQGGRGGLFCSARLSALITFPTARFSPTMLRRRPRYAPNDGFRAALFVPRP